MAKRIEIDAPLFDAIGSPGPWTGFGPVLETTPELLADFRAHVARARASIAEGFALDLTDPSPIPDLLEEVLSDAWKTGWSPKTGNVRLFVSEFGLVLTDAILQMLGPELAFRSGKDYLHLSCYWPREQFEAFPFHKVYKRMTNREGDSLAFFVRGLRYSLKDAVTRS